MGGFCASSFIFLFFSFLSYFFFFPCPQVVRAAEEAASTLAGSIHSEQCIKVLCPIVQTADYPINLAAIKMQTKVIERIPKESLVQLLADIIPGLLQVKNRPPRESEFPISLAQILKLQAAVSSYMLTQMMSQCESVVRCVPALAASWKQSEDLAFKRPFRAQDRPQNSQTFIRVYEVQNTW